VPPRATPDRDDPARRGHVADQQAVQQALAGIFQAHETKALGIIGLLVGYICIFFTKVMEMQSILVGVLGISLTTILLLLLNPELNFRSTQWWLRSITVIILSILLTSPQLYFAWTTSVAEARAGAIQQRDAAISRAQDINVPSRITIETSPGR
jgi:predicted Co/Zn/Cd cation transporter (cation efflux family)